MWTNLRSSAALWFKRLQPLAVLSVLLLSNSASAKTSSKGQALNVVFMLADDLGWAELLEHGGVADFCGTLTHGYSSPMGLPCATTRSGRAVPPS